MTFVKTLWLVTIPRIGLGAIFGTAALSGFALALLVERLLR